MGSSRHPGTVGLEAAVSSDGDSLCGSGFRATAAQQPGPVDASSLTAEEQELLLDITQLVLDLVGIVDPTPMADGSNAVISAGRSDWTGAGLSLIGVVPYVGDLAKLGKMSRWRATIDKALMLSRRSAAFRARVSPALGKLHSLLLLLPLQKWPAGVRGTLEAMRDRLAQFAGLGGRLGRADALARILSKAVHDPDMVLDRIVLGAKQSGRSSRARPAEEVLEELAGELRNFQGKPTLRVTRRTETAVRGSDTLGQPLVNAATGEVHKANDMGRYLVPGGDLAKAADREASALPMHWNKLNALEVQEIPAGSLVLDGIAAAQAGKRGGGPQIAHLGQLFSDGQVFAPAERVIRSGKTRLAGGKLVGDQ